MRFNMRASAGTCGSRICPNPCGHFRGHVQGEVGQVQLQELIVCHNVSFIHDRRMVLVGGPLHNHTVLYNSFKHRSCVCSVHALQTFQAICYLHLRLHILHDRWQPGRSKGHQNMLVDDLRHLLIHRCCLQALSYLAWRLVQQGHVIMQLGNRNLQRHGLVEESETSDPRLRNQKLRHEGKGRQAPGPGKGKGRPWQGFPGKMPALDKKIDCRVPSNQTGSPWLV